MDGKTYRLDVDFGTIRGKIKPMHGVGQPPFLGMNDGCFHYLTEAHIPYSRLHDVGGAFGGNLYVDIPNLFRDFDADENDPASYDFAFTDWLISSLVKAKVEPIFRLGVTIENYYYVRSYRIHPPKDFEKWAGICEHVVMHYLDGWADGFHYPITRWEVWNEPDNTLPNGGNQMWTGTPEEYYRLYAVTSKRLKARFGDRIMVGGFASCGFYALFEDQKRPDTEFFITYFHDFLKYIRRENAPMDFFSWHSYADVERTKVMARYVDQTLTEYGYGDVETQLNEWNNAAPKRELLGTSRAAALAAAMMLAQQREKTSLLCYYDARIGASVYGGLFNPITLKPFCAYYAFAAFGELYDLGAETECACDAPGVYAIAATGRGKRAVMIANTNESNVILKTNLPQDMAVFCIDQEHLMVAVEMGAERIELKGNQVLLLR